MKRQTPSGGLVLLCLLVVTTSTSAGAQGMPKPRPAGFRLFARAVAEITVNRVECGFSTDEVCVDITDASPGGSWPKHSPQSYMFNSGMQVAGMIDSAAGFAWAGDTTDAFVFDAKGTTQHGQQVEPIWNYSDPDDRAHWPQAGRWPSGGGADGQ